jgi:hypothetical protein
MSDEENRDSGKVIRPPHPEWGRNWRKGPADTKGGQKAGRVARAKAVLLQPLPPDSELLLEAIGTLRSVHLDPDCAEASRVGAAKAIIEHVTGRHPSQDGVDEPLSEAEEDEYLKLLQERKARRQAG